jgi:hypothetical protein
VNAAPNRKPSRTRTPYWVSIFVATTVLLAVLAAGRVAERKRVEENYVASAHASAAKMAADFAHHLDQLAEDTHLLAEQFWQPGQTPDYPKAIRTRVLADGVRVLASAVHHCRGLIFSQNGRDFEVALDPTEDPALEPWLKEQGAPGLLRRRTLATRLLGPMHRAGRAAVLRAGPEPALRHGARRRGCPPPFRNLAAWPSERTRRFVLAGRRGNPVGRLRLVRHLPGA